MGLILWLILLSILDFKSLRIENKYILPVIMFMYFYTFVQSKVLLCLGGSFLVAGIYLLIYLLKSNAIGAADIKVLLAIGGFLGLKSLYVCSLFLLILQIATLVAVIILKIFTTRKIFPYLPVITVSFIMLTPVITV